MGNNTIYIKVKKEDCEDFSLFVQGCHQKGTSIKKYHEITEDANSGALLSLDTIICQLFHFLNRYYNNLYFFWTLYNFYF